MPASGRSTLVLWGLVGIVVLMLGGRALLQDRGASAAPAPAFAAPPASGADPIAAAPPPGRLVVDVTGAVRRPGVYRLPAGARVQEAVRRAGGATRRADRAAVNLAAKVADGQQILVPERVPVAGASPGAAVAGGGAPAPAGPVSLNSATAEQLDQLDGVGPATAAKIIAWRTANGGFSSVDDLAQVAGIGPKKLEALRPQVAP
jgi:competence protein ComEA